MNAPTAMVEVRRATKRFGSFLAVDGVDLSVANGEFLTLLGPSGCGKTTLLRMIAGFETPDEGEVWLEGRDVTVLPSYRRNVNQVFQSYALFPHLTVYENIAFGLRMQQLGRAEIEARVKEAIALVALEGREDRKPDQLSGGQKQRVALARALAPRPAVLLLDEPLAALDAKLRQTMQLELKRLQRQVGLTFVFVTHDQEEALTMSDRIAVMNQGKIEQIGSARDIYHRPNTPFVAHFVGETNLLPAELLSLDGAQARVRLAGAFECVLPPGAWPAGARSAQVALRPEKLQLASGPVPEAVSFSATVIEKVFKGQMEHLVLGTENGVRLKAIAPNERQFGSSCCIGETIWCGAHPSDFSVIA